MTECPICVEKYTGTTRCKVTCPYCGGNCCVGCFKTFLLGSNKTTPNCMHCDREFSLDFIAANTNKTFYTNNYRAKRAGDLLSQERSLLPDTQHLVERELIHERMEVEVQKLQVQIREYKEKIKQCQREAERLRSRYWRDIDGIRTVRKEKRKFVMGCPVGTCRGFLSTAWKCGTCEVYVCSECRLPKNGREDPEHECDPNDVATAKMLATETKPCPKCAVPIYKINGCDQMWCVECETPFSWRTLEIVTGTIHNPHFYQRQRDRNGGVAPRVAGDDPCAEMNGLPWIGQVDRVLQTRGYEWPNYTSIHRLVVHIQGVTLRYYPYRLNMVDGSDLRVAYLRNRLTDERWLSALKKRQKEMEKNRAVHNILELFYVTLTDIFNMYITENRMDDPDTACREIRQYCNRELSKVRSTYSMKIPYIDNNWTVKIK